MLLRIVFENTDNTIWVFSEIYYCSLKLVFSIFSAFFDNKKIGNQTCWVSLVPFLKTVFCSQNQGEQGKQV